MLGGSGSGVVGLVLLLDLFKLGDVGIEVGVLLKSDKELGLLGAVAHLNSLGLDLLEGGIVVSKVMVLDRNAKIMKASSTW